MRAVVLAGGLGLRLRPYTTVLPKPLVPVGDRPVLEHILLRLAAAEIFRVDLCVSHLGELIQAYFAQARSLPPEMSLAWKWESEPRGTAGALALVEDLDETFVAINGDVLTTVDFDALVAHHRRSDAALTIAVQQREVGVELGVVESDDGVVTGYREKPRLPFDVSLGIYVYEPHVLGFLPPTGAYQFPELVLDLVAQGERVVTFHSDAESYDIGTFAEHERASRALAARPESFGVEAPRPGERVHAPPGSD